MTFENLNITIADTKTPLVLLWGPPYTGKTMLLARTVWYFMQRVELLYKLDDIFLPPTFHYEIMQYEQVIRGMAVAPKAHLPMMSSAIRPNGQKVCQIIDIPGECCFNPYEEVQVYPSFINQILVTPNKKIFMIFIEKDWCDHKMRTSYVQSIHQLRWSMSPKDKIIFVVPKVDKLEFSTMKYLFKEVRNQYPHLFEPFETNNPLIKLFRPYNFEFVPFSAGSFSYNTYGSGINCYCEGDSNFPRMLWKAIYKHLG